MFRNHLALSLRPAGALALAVTFIATIGLAGAPAPAAEATVDLGSTGSFAVLAGQSVTSGVVEHSESMHLAILRAGDLITVGLSDNTTVTFEVQRVATYANAGFPAQHVYAGTFDRPGLNLVTCGREYDRDRDGYRANVVVFTQRVES